MPIRKNASMENYIEDFKKSDAPQLKNKPEEKKVQMAVAAKLQAKNKKMEENTKNPLNQDFFDNLYKDLSQAPNGKKFLEDYGIIDANDLMIKLTTYKSRKEMYMDLRKEYALHQMHKQELDKFFGISGETNTITEKKAKKGATYCGRCGHTHVKGTRCPRPFIKEGEKEDITGPKGKPDGKIDSEDYLAKRDAAIKKAMKVKNEIVANVMGKIKEGTAITIDYADSNKEDDVLNTTSGTAVTNIIKTLKTSPGFKGKVKADGKPLFTKESLYEGMHADYEGKMAKAQLISIVKNAKDLFDSMDDNTQLKSWIQSKLTKAEDYISSVRTYLDGESLSTTTPLVHNGEAVRDDEGAALNIGDVVKAADGKIYQVVFSYSEGKPFLTPFDLKRRKPVNLRERHYFDSVAEGSQEGMPLAIKTSKVMDASATKGGFMR